MARIKNDYYRNSYELEVAVVKLKTMDEKKASMLFGTIQDEKPPASILKTKARNQSYKDIPLESLEYLWVGSDKADILTRMRAKSAYLVRCDEHTNPRKGILFSYSENMECLYRAETDMLEKVYKLKTGNVVAYETQDVDVTKLFQDIGVLEE